MSDVMLGSFFAINVKPEHKEAFLDASIFMAQSVVSEENGVFQFQFTVDASNPNRFYFYEVFRDDAAIEEHRATSVFGNWWNTVQPMLESEMEVIAKMHSIFPTKNGFEAQKPGLLQW